MDLPKPFARRRPLAALIALALALPGVAQGQPGGAEAARILFGDAAPGAPRIEVRPAPPPPGRAAPSPGLRLVATTLGDRVIHRAQADRFALAGDLPEIHLGSPAQRLVAVLSEGAEGCCGTWHFFGTGPEGLAFLGTAPAGSATPPRPVALTRGGETQLLLGDPSFDGWGGSGPLADLRPPVGLRLRGGRLRADGPSMRRTVAEALGPACEATSPEPGATGAPPETVEQAARRIRALPWSPEAEARLARWAMCLVYGGRPVEARRLVGLGWPAHTPGAIELERRLAARLACSPWRAAVVEASEPGLPFLSAECRPRP